MTEREDDDRARAIGGNLRALRRRRGLSIERLAEASGVSRSAISDIERGRTVPTVNVVGRLSRALRVDFSTLVGELPRAAIVLRRGEPCDAGEAVRASRARSRALCPDARPSAAAFYEVRIPARSRHAVAEVHPGLVQHVLVAEGHIAIELGDDHYVLGPGDAIQLRVAAPCTYVSWSADPTVLYVVMAPPDDAGVAAAARSR